MLEANCTVELHNKTFIDGSVAAQRPHLCSITWHPPDPALTLWHQRNVGDGDRRHLLLDLKARESSRGPRHLCSRWQLSAETLTAGFQSPRLTEKGMPPSYPSAQLRDWHLVWPNDTSLKLWWSNPCHSDEESSRINAFIWFWVVT